MYRGAVESLFRWPVKSLRGESVAAARLDHRGMAGDRAYALIDRRPEHDGKPLTVRQRPGMLSWSATYAPGGGGADSPADPTDPPVLRSPNGVTWTWDDPGLPAALADSYGVPLSLRAADGQQDRGPTVLVTFEASRRALGDELGAEVETERFRPNVHVNLDAPPFFEQACREGTVLTVGEVVLEVTGKNAGPCIRCAVPSWDPHGRERWPLLQKHLIAEHENIFGLIMRVTQPGTVRLGDPVELRPAAS